MKISIKILILFLAFISPNIINADNSRYQSINALIQNYDFAGAIEQIGKINLATSDIDLIKLKATALKGLKHYQEVIPYYEFLFSKDTTDLKTGIDLGYCYQYMGYFKKEQKLYHTLTDSHKNSLYLIQLLANSYYLDNDFSNAIAHYNALYLVDSTLYITKQLAQCYDNINMTDKAIEYYKKVLELNFSDLQSAYRLSNIYKQKKDYKKGLEITNKYLETDSLSVLILRMDGLLNFLNKDFKTSTKRFEKCIFLADTSDFTNKYMGYSYFKTEQYEKAKDYLEKAFLADTTNADLCYALGLSCVYSIYKKKGIEYLEKTLDLMKPSPSTLSQVYKSLANANSGFYKYNEALSAFMKALELTPDDAMLKYELAMHYEYNIKNMDLALKYYRDFLKSKESTDSNTGVQLPKELMDYYYNYAEKRIAEIKKNTNKLNN
jgi:tetratricopeptide (TPR) repeat protein